MKSVLNIYLRNTHIDSTIEFYFSLPLDAICISIHHCAPKITVNYYISESKIYRESLIDKDSYVGIVG